jgi:hypothetical protein
VTLRYPYEVRKEDEYFEDIEDEKIPKDMMELASHIVETKSGHFKLEEFEDHYEDALKELLKKKQSGEKIEAPRAREPAKVISLMDALRRSVDAERGGGRGQSERRPAQRRTPKKAGRVICEAEEGRLILARRKPSVVQNPRPMLRWHSRCHVTISGRCAGGSSRAADRYDMPSWMA